MDYSLRDIMQETINTRLCVDNRWLTWDDVAGWEVREQKPYAHLSTILYSGTSYTKAIDILLGKEY